MERIHRLLREVLERGVRSGMIRVDLDTVAAAFVIIALIQGLAVRWSLSERRFDLVEEGERLLAVVFQGFVVVHKLRS